MKHLWILAWFALLLASCGYGQINPEFITSRPDSETLSLQTPITTPTPTIFVDVRTPAPDTIEIVLSGGYFSIADANGTVFPGEFCQPCTIYLPPGEYRWWAYIPVPTAPYGCFETLEYYGYQKEGSFLASRDRITLRVKLGSVIAFCTPTPEGK